MSKFDSTKMLHPKRRAREAGTRLVHPLTQDHRYCQYAHTDHVEGVEEIRVYFILASVLQAASSSVGANLSPFVSGFPGGRVKQHPIANPNRHGGEAFGVRTTWGWVQ